MSRWSDLSDADLDARLANELRTLSDSARVGPEWARLELLPAVHAAIGGSRPSVRSSGIERLAGVAASAAVLVLIALAVLTRLPDSMPGGPYGEDQVGDFVLTISAGEPFYAPGQPIDIEATLTYVGPDDAVELAGVTHMINGFSARQLDGLLAMGPGWDEPCVRHQLRRNEPLRTGYVKSAGWSDDDAHADFYRQWSQEPELTLPAGLWEITAYSQFTVAPECSAEQVSLQASLELLVGEQADASPTATPTPTQEPTSTPQPSPDAGLECPYGDDRPTDVTFIDRTGLVQSCAANTGDQLDEELSVVNRAGEPLYLDIAWRVPELCSPMPATVEFWPGRNPWTFALVINAETTSDPAACWTAVGHQSVSLILSKYLAANLIEAVYLRDGVRTVTSETTVGRFELTFSTDRRQYLAGDRIDLRYSLSYDGPAPTVRLAGGLLHGPSYKQLDGDLEMFQVYPAICAHNLAMSREEPIAGFGGKVVSIVDGPNAEFYRRWMEDPMLWLPAGLWRITVSTDFWTGDSCGQGEHVDLSASVIVRVTETPAESPAPIPTPATPPPATPSPSVPGEFSCDPLYFTLIDRTGLVSSCTMIWPAARGGDEPFVFNPREDQRALDIAWLGQDPRACGPEPPRTTLTLTRLARLPTEPVEPGPYLLRLETQLQPATGCRTVAAWQGVRLTLSQPVDADEVMVLIDGGSDPRSTADTDQGSFELTVGASKEAYAAGESIEVDASLRYDGGEPTIFASGGEPLIAFSVEQLDGDLEMPGGIAESCNRYVLHRGSPLRQPFTKSVAYGEDDPNADFYRRWYEDPEFTLPPGIWRISAHSRFEPGFDCADSVSLRASVVIVVEATASGEITLRTGEPPLSSMGVRCVTWHLAVATSRHIPIRDLVWPTSSVSLAPSCGRSATRPVEEPPALSCSVPTEGSPPARATLCNSAAAMALTMPSVCVAACGSSRQRRPAN